MDQDITLEIGELHEASEWCLGLRRADGGDVYLLNESDYPRESWDVCLHACGIICSFFWDVEGMEMGVKRGRRALPGVSAPDPQPCDYLSSFSVQRSSAVPGRGPVRLEG